MKQNNHISKVANRRWSTYTKNAFYAAKTIVMSKLFLIGFAIVTMFGIYMGALHLTDNFHEVIPGQVYRSAQLEAGDIRDLSEKYGIKTMLNLRGDNTGSAWYDAEIKEANTANLTHINFRMKASRGLSQEEAIKLIAIMRDAPKPLLIHCQGGSDRSGLASALYLAAIEQKDVFEAKMQLSPIYGHMPSGETDAMCMTFDAIKQLFALPKS